MTLAWQLSRRSSTATGFEPAIIRFQFDEEPPQTSSILKQNGKQLLSAGKNKKGMR